MLLEWGQRQEAPGQAVDKMLELHKKKMLEQHNE
jgi:hypothetical protein